MRENKTPTLNILWQTFRMAITLWRRERAKNWEVVFFFVFCLFCIAYTKNYNFQRSLFPKHFHSLFPTSLPCPFPSSWDTDSYSERPPVYYFCTVYISLVCFDFTSTWLDPELFCAGYILIIFNLFQFNL